MAVYTPLTHDDIAGFLAGMPALGNMIEFTGILQGIDNTNYKITTETGSYILTLFEQRINPDDIPYFLGLMHHMSAQGIICPNPLLRGQIHKKPAALFSFLDGRGVEPADITPALCYELGTLLARMHVIGQNFPATRTNSMSFDAWEARLRRVNDHSTSKDTRKGTRKDTATPFLEELDFLKTHWPHNLPTGAIHADLFPDNVFIQNAHICGVIDFYFAATDYLAYDLAIVMNAWCFDTQITFCPDRWWSLLSGYESVRPLTPAEQSAYPLLCRGAALRFVASRLHDFVFHDPSHLVTPKNPNDYITLLDFHRHAPSLFA